MSFVIVTDSSANLTDALIDQYDIRVLSLRFYVSGRVDSYIKGKSPDYQQFYTMMRNKGEHHHHADQSRSVQSGVPRDSRRGDDLLYIGFSLGAFGHLSGRTYGTRADQEGLSPIANLRRWIPWGLPWARVC